MKKKMYILLENMGPILAKAVKKGFCKEMAFYKEPKGGELHGTEKSRECE